MKSILCIYDMINYASKHESPQVVASGTQVWGFSLLLAVQDL